MREFARHDPPAEKQARQLMDTIPGVGWITIDVFLAETADVRRFSSQKKLTAYAGLSPGYRESADKRRELGITHSGSRLLRWVLVQADLLDAYPRLKRADIQAALSYAADTLAHEEVIVEPRHRRTGS